MKPRPAGAIFPRLHSTLPYLTFLALMFLLAAGANSQQEADSTFDVRVAHPSYTTTHPKVLFDEAHNNFHTSSGRYKPFADLISNDGYQVLPNKRKFEKRTLAGFDILVIANALGSPDVDAREASNPAFTESECDAVRDWVREGGNLLLIADHAPAGGAAANLATRFGVEMSKAYVADPTNFQRIALDASWIVFSRENRALADNAITRGRNNSEQINRVMSFTGQSLKGPPESVAILKLSDAAYDVFDFKNPEKAKTTSAAGRAQAVALEFGKGRVIVFGEAAMLAAQEKNFGMNYPGIDNRQFALNVIHWLSGLMR
jgi:hypothetical protein